MTLAELVEAGYSDAQIAEHLGVSARTVIRRRQRAGLASRWTPEVPEHGTHARYRRGCRCSDCRAANSAETAAWRSRYQAVTTPTALNAREHWTAEDDAFLMTTDLTLSQAARALNRTWGSVAYRLNLLRSRQPA